MTCRGNWFNIYLILEEQGKYTKHQWGMGKHNKSAKVNHITYLLPAEIFVLPSASLAERAAMPTEGKTVDSIT